MARDGALYLIGRFRTHSTLEARVWTRVNLELQPFAVSLKLERLKVWKKNFIMFGTGTFQAHTIQRLSHADEQSHGILIIIQQIRLGPASSDSSWWLPPTDNHHHGWMILPPILLIIPHNLFRLNVSSDLPWRLSCCDEGSHFWVILTCISLIIQQIWPVTLPSDAPRWLSPIDYHCIGWMILLTILLILRHILFGLVAEIR